MGTLAPARRAALALVSECRRRAARVRDVARDDAGMAALADQDRSLALRLSLGATAACATLDKMIDARLRRASAVEPRVRDALRLATFELCYLATPPAVAASQGVELVRSVAPRAAGLANAVLRRIAREARPQIAEARERCEAGAERKGDLELVSALPAWLVARLLADRGLDAARRLCLAQLEPAPVYVAAQGRRHGAEEMRRLLGGYGMEPEALAGLPGSFRLGNAAPLAASGLVERADLAVADLSAQLVCRLAAPEAPAAMLEVGQGRGTKSLLLASGTGAVWPTRIVGVDSVAYKVRVASRRMQTAGLADVVSCCELDACSLSDEESLPAELRGPFASVLIDAPCSGTGTMRRHPEIAASLSADDVRSLADLQMRLLKAASLRVASGGSLVYATCSVLSMEDERVVKAFLASEEGARFSVVPVCEAPACASCDELAALVGAHQTPEGYLLTMPAPAEEDGHFCAVLRAT